MRRFIAEFILMITHSNLELESGIDPTVIIIEKYGNNGIQGISQ